jgi:hypothetical protein
MCLSENLIVILSEAKDLPGIGIALAVDIDLHQDSSLYTE